MELNWITPSQAAEQWGISERQVQSLCKSGKIKNAMRIGQRSWVIPIDTPRPLDGRTKVVKMQKEAYDE